MARKTSIEKLGIGDAVIEARRKGKSFRKIADEFNVSLKVVRYFLQITLCRSET